MHFNLIELSFIRVCMTKHCSLQAPEGSFPQRRGYTFPPALLTLHLSPNIRKDYYEETKPSFELMWDAHDQQWKFEVCLSQTPILPELSPSSVTFTGVLLLSFTMCTAVCCILNHPIPDLHFKKINLNFSGSVTYMPHHVT